MRGNDVVIWYDEKLNTTDAEEEIFKFQQVLVAFHDDSTYLIAIFKGCLNPEIFNAGYSISNSNFLGVFYHHF